MGKNLDEFKLVDVTINELIPILQKFYNEKMSQKSSAIFGGVRTKADLMYKNLAWFT
jgi:hypothetical protein